MTKSPDRQITVDGKTYTIRFSFRAFKRLNEHFGTKTLRELGEALASPDIDLDTIVAIAWAGLATHHLDEPIEVAEEICDDLGFYAIKDMLNDAFVAAQGEVQKQGGGQGSQANPTKPGRLKR